MTLSGSGILVQLLRSAPTWPDPLDSGGGHEDSPKEWKAAPMFHPCPHSEPTALMDQETQLFLLCPQEWRLLSMYVA